jgi:hypothetical protein
MKYFSSFCWRGFGSIAIALVTMKTGMAAEVIVQNTNDAFAGSLRQAVTNAASGDTIVFQIPKTTAGGYNALTDVFTIDLTTAGAITIAKDLVIDAGTSKIVVRGNSVSIFNITSGTVKISGLTLASGRAGPEGAGTILNNGVLTVRNCLVRDSSAGGDQGAIQNKAGATLVLLNCSFVGNMGGAAVTNLGSLVVRDSTFYNNHVNFAAIDNRSATGAAVRNCIVAGTTGIFGGAMFDVRGAFVSEGYNIVQNTNGTTGFGATGDQIGASNVQIKLGSLQDNGGLTNTMLPTAGSIAIDQGNRGVDGNGQPINIDGRGQPRPVNQPSVLEPPGGDGSDVGAVEVGLPQAGPILTVTNTSEHFDGECTVDDCTLLEATIVANGNGDANTINFAAGLTGEISTALSANGLEIDFPVTINGPGARVLSLSGNNAGPVLNVMGQNVSISGLTIFDGFKANGDGAGIYNTGGLTLTDCTVVANYAANGNGGGIYNATGAILVLNRCTVRANNAGQFGGGVYNDATFAATDCTFSGDQALNGGGIITRFANGVSSTTLRNCTITACVSFSTGTNSGNGGGGFYAEGGGPQHHIANTLIAGNTSGANPSTNPDVRGQITSDGHNFIGIVGFSTGFSDNVSGDQVGTLAAPKNPQLDALRNNGGPTDTHALLSGSSAINAGDDGLAPINDQRGFPRVGSSDIGAFEFGSALPTPTPTATATATPSAAPTGTPVATPTATPTVAPGLVGNVSTRLPVGAGDNVLIEGFIVQGPNGSTKKIMVRAIGPSLLPFGITDALTNPTLEIRDASNALIASNDDWNTTQVGGIIIGEQSAEISGSGLAPGNSAESAIIANLAPGSYTAVVRGFGGGTGTGVVDAYDLSAASPARLANIATRGLIQPGDKLMIAGFIIQNGPVRAVVLAVGPSLSAFGISNALPDTTLQLRDENGAIVRENDDWQSDQKAEIEATGLQPSDPREAAIIVDMPPGQYTAQVRGKPEQTGIGVVQVFFLQ